MPTVDLITYCCPKDIHKLYAGFDALVDSHKYPFREIVVIRQRCRGIDAGTLTRPCRVLEAEDWPGPEIRKEFNIVEDDPEADNASKPNTKFYWRWNCWNPLIGLKASDADYIAFTDCDNVLRGDMPGHSWVDRGLHILQTQPEVFMVCPNQWSEQNGDVRVKDISQCMFLCERQRFLGLDYDAPFPPEVSKGEYHYSFEGRLWRYAQNHTVWRVMLGGPPLLIHLAW